MHEGIGCAVISLDGSRLLGMTQLFKHVANGDSLLCIVEETRCFCLSGRSYNMLEGAAFDQEGTIHKAEGRIVLIVASDATAGQWGNQVCSIRIDCQLHVTGIEAKKCVWV